MFSKLSLKMMYSALSKCKVPTPDTNNPIEIDEDALLTFVAWGDPQVSVLSPLRSARLSAACKDIENVKGKLDAILLLGDITEYGKKCEYQMVSDILNSVNSKFEHLIGITGNHDIRLRPYRKQVRRFNKFIFSIKGGCVGPDKHYYFSKEINGVKFIIMGADRASFESAHIGNAQLKWLDSEIKDAADRNIPALVLNHQTLDRTNGLPVTWLGKGDWRGSVGKQSDKIKEIFEKYTNVFFITGHLHYGVSEYNFQDCGKFKSLSVPTVGVLNHGKFSHNSQGYVVSVYKDKIVGRARLFGKGEWVDDSVPNAKFEFQI